MMLYGSLSVSPASGGSRSLPAATRSAQPRNPGRGRPSVSTQRSPRIPGSFPRIRSSVSANAPAATTIAASQFASRLASPDSWSSGLIGATTALLGRLGQLHFDLAPVEIAPVEARHGFLRLLGRRHLDEAEAPRPAGPGVGHDRRGLDDPGGGEDLAQTLTGDGEREAADEQFVRHDVSPCHIFR